MGTSTDHGGGTGGNWTPAKRASSYYARHGGCDRAERALGRLVTALGGAGALAGRSTAATGGVQQLGRTLSLAAADGLDAALRDAGLEELIGRPAVEVVAALVDAIAGPGENLEGQAARSAACDILEDLAESAESYEDLAGVLPNADEIAVILEHFLAAYVYWRLLPILDERLERLDDPKQRVRRDRELREVIEAIVELNFKRGDIDPASWSRGSVQDAECLLNEVLDYLEEQGS